MADVRCQMVNGIFADLLEGGGNLELLHTFFCMLQTVMSTRTKAQLLQSCWALGILKLPNSNIQGALFV